MAARTLPIGTVIGPRDLYVADLPADFIPDQAIRDPELPIGLLVLAVSVNVLSSDA